jgi:hypothetical protein
MQIKHFLFGLSMTNYELCYTSRKGLHTLKSKKHLRNTMIQATVQVIHLGFLQKGDRVDVNTMYYACSAQYTTIQNNILCCIYSMSSVQM